MAAPILDGKSLAAATRTALKREADALVRRGVRPGPAVVDLPKLVTADMVKRACGLDHAAPGGVGPTTIATLLENCIRAAARE